MCGYQSFMCPNNTSALKISFNVTGLIIALLLPRRLLVSASQDGKLIIWDSYTTNKVRLAWPHLEESKRSFHI